MNPENHPKNPGITNQIGRRVPLLFGIILALAAVFVIPWHVPLPMPICGESYSFGFSNRAAVVGLCLAMALMFVVLWRRQSSGQSLDWLERKPLFWPRYREARGEYIVLMVFSLLMAGVILAWNAFLVAPYWGESRYFLTRIDLIYLGMKPYADFQFNYGPALIYSPLLLDWLSKGLLGIENAYAWCLALGYISGFACLFLFLRAIRLPDTSRPWVLAVLMLNWCVLTMAMQYIPIRHTLLPALLVMAGYLVHGAERQPGKMFFSALVIFGGGIGCFLISPEMGIAYWAGMLAVVVVMLISRKFITASLIVCSLAASAGSVHTLTSGYFHALISFGSGAWNFPIYPNLQNLFFIGACLSVLPLLGCAVLQNATDARAPAAAACGGAAVVLLPAALGRCDPGHVLINGLIILVLGFAFLFSLSLRHFKLGIWAFSLIFGLFGQFSYWKMYRHQYVNAVEQARYHASHRTEFEHWKEQWHQHQLKMFGKPLFNWGKPLPYPDWAEKIPETHGLGAPIRISDPLDRFLKLRSDYRTTYFPTMCPDMFSPQDVKRSADEALRFDRILVPISITDAAQKTLDIGDYGEISQVIMSVLMIYPVKSRVRNPPFDPTRELALKIIPETEVVWSNDQFRLLKPLKASPDHPGGAGR
ncbi:MAG: hypothetical protein SFU85_11110 [Candidatus Methylacidiphilales bacterium]|nr:hypothetical protein [Candidatus Methylacidiphilales bacterium]